MEIQGHYVEQDGQRRTERSPIDQIRDDRRKPPLLGQPAHHRSIQNQNSAVTGCSRNTIAGSEVISGGHQAVEWPQEQRDGQVEYTAKKQRRAGENPDVRKVRRQAQKPEDNSDS